MRGIKRVLFLFITSFMVMGLTGCTEKVLTKEEAKTKLEYDKRILETITKSAGEFPSDSSEKTFNEAIEKMKKDVNSLFKSSKESSNLKLKDEILKELKFLEVAYGQLLNESDSIQSYVAFLDLEAINDEHRLAIKKIYESSKSDIEKILINFFDDIEEAAKHNTELDPLTLQSEKLMNAYTKLNKLYNLNSNSEYLALYEEKMPVFKEKISERFSLDNSEISFLDVNTQSEKDSIWNQSKTIVKDLVKAGKLTFPTSVMSSDVVVKKSGSIYVIKSYVDVANNETTERKEFTLKLDISGDYTMYISLDIK